MAEHPRSLADQLRGWPEEELLHLLESRPDLATPAPQDSAQLASRAGTRASVARCLDRLTVLQLAVLDTAVALGDAVSVQTLQEHLDASPESVAEAVDRLRGLALLWGAGDELRAVGVLAEGLGTSVSRLGPQAQVLLASCGADRIASLVEGLRLEATGDRDRDIAAISAHLARPTAVEELVEEVSPGAREILRHLSEQNAAGRVRSTDRATAGGEDTAPVDELLARGLLMTRDRHHVAVPREVALALGHRTPTHSRLDGPPALATSARNAALVDRAAAGAAFEFVRHVELVLEHWGTTSPTALRGGGLGVRDLRGAAELLHVDDRVAALHVEVAAAAGLLAVADTEDQDSAWMPTEAFDHWSSGSVADRWSRLAVSWLRNPRLTGLVGSRDDSRKSVNALSPDLERDWLVETRRMSLEEVARLGPGEVLAAGTGPPSLVDRLRWLRPRRPPPRSAAVAWVLEEAAVLGVMALGGVAGHGRTLLSPEQPERAAPAALEPLLPETVDHVLLQADLTAIAPGPLHHDLARSLATMADVESRGGATVFRFTAASVRRAFDSGWSAAEVQDFLVASSRTPVPQPLSYLVDDVSRRFGTVRVGVAESFLRSDDESALAELAHNPKASGLRLRKIAPTVLVSDVPVDVLLSRLRDLGVAPVVEATDGTVRVVRKGSHRAKTPRRGPASDEIGAARLAARRTSVVRAIRTGDRAAASRPTRRQDAPRSSPASVLAALREAADARETVWIGYLDNHGAKVERIVDPVHVHAGQLTAYDHRGDKVRSFAVHRITDVAPADR